MNTFAYAVVFLLPGNSVIRVQANIPCYNWVYIWRGHDLWIVVAEFKTLIINSLDGKKRERLNSK